jgi:AcrR family transcriptional regulator
MDSRPASLRRLKKARTREAIVASAFRLFESRGFEGTTVEQIAHAAEVSQRTFFRYFATKQAVVFAGHAERVARFRALLENQRKRRAPVDAVFQVLTEVAHDYQKRREALLREYRLVQRNPELIARDVELDYEYEFLVAESLAGRGRPGGRIPRRARILAGAIFGAVRATMADWFAGGCRADLIQLGRQTMAILEAGVRAEPDEAE